MQFILLINVKMPTIVGILTFMSRITKTTKSFKARNVVIFSGFFMSSENFVLSWVEYEKKLITLRQAYRAALGSVMTVVVKPRLEGTDLCKY